MSKSKEENEIEFMSNKLDNVVSEDGLVVYYGERALNEELVGYVANYADICAEKINQYKEFKEKFDSVTLGTILSEMKKQGIIINDDAVREFLNLQAEELRSKIDKTQNTKQQIKTQKQLDKLDPIIEALDPIIKYERLMESYNKSSNLAAAMFILYSNDKDLPNFRLKIKYLDLDTDITSFSQTSAPNPKIHEAELFDGIAGDARIAASMTTHSETRTMSIIAKHRELLFQEIKRLVKEEDRSSYRLTFYLATQKDTCCLCDRSIRNFAVYLDKELKGAEINLADRVDCSISYSVPYATDHEMNVIINRITQEDEKDGVLLGLAKEIIGREVIEPKERVRLLFRLIKMGVACYNKTNDYEQVGNFTFGEYRELKKDEIQTKDITLDNIINTIVALRQKDGFEILIKNTLEVELLADEVRYRKVHIPTQTHLITTPQKVTDDIGDDDNRQAEYNTPTASSTASSSDARSDRLSPSDEYSSNTSTPPSTPGKRGSNNTFTSASTRERGGNASVLSPLRAKSGKGTFNSGSPVVVKALSEVTPGSRKAAVSRLIYDDKHEERKHNEVTSDEAQRVIRFDESPQTSPLRISTGLGKTKADKVQKGSDEKSRE